MMFRKKEIILIGTGSTAFSLTNGLANAGIPPSLVLSRTSSAAHLFAKHFKIPAFSDDIDVILPKPSLIILAIPDDVITETADRLSVLKHPFRKSTVIHLSGAVDRTALLALSAKGAHTASFHMLQTFTRSRFSPLKDVPAAIEASDTGTERLLANFARLLEMKPLVIQQELKRIIHLIGVFVSNFLIGNLAAAEMLARSLPGTISFKDLIAPILTAAVQNAMNSEFLDSLSGPVRRGDAQSVRAHIELLRSFQKSLGLETAEASYSAQSLHLLTLLNMNVEPSDPTSGKREIIRQMLNETFRAGKNDTLTKV